jgi:glycosyltransferase involved in cell wall biosynthesis
MNGISVRAKCSFFESENVEDLAAQILTLARDKERRHTLRERGTQFIEKHNWDSKKHEYFNLLDQLIHRRPALG